MANNPLGINHRLCALSSWRGLIRFALLGLALSTIPPGPASAQEPDVNPFQELALFKRFTFINGFFSTKGGEENLQISERELKNLIILKLRTYLKDVPYTETPLQETKPDQGNARFVCEVMSVSTDDHLLIAFQFRCVAGLMPGSGEIWEDAKIAIVGKLHVREGFRRAIDEEIESFAGEYYRAKGQQKTGSQ